MTRLRYVIARLGTPPNAYPQVLFYDNHWCLRMGPKFADWRSFESVDDLLECLLEETIEPQVRHQQLLDTVRVSERAHQATLEHLARYRTLIEQSIPKVFTRIYR